MSTLPGQVSGAPQATSAITYYAASRFLEQASMGPTPEAVADVQRLGFAAWIDAQMRLPVSRLSIPAELVDFDDRDSATVERLRDHFPAAVMDQAVGAEDTLRHRVAWVLSNLLVVSVKKVSEYGGLEYWNTLMSGAFGHYAELLKAVTVHPAMGHYLDNVNNRKDALNENYARELLQLFSLGTVRLNGDGTPQKDARGALLETYTQQDVIDTTRAISGWRYAPNPANDLIKGPNANRFNYGKALVADEASHDTGDKTVMGQRIGAGGSAARDLDALIEIISAHPNLAPFVSRRLIQGLTTSDPSPAYVRRVVAVFKQSGGHLGAVVKAILLDPEARAADQPGRSVAGFGRIREFHLMHTHTLRALGCRRAVRDISRPSRAQSMVLTADSVFNFFPPDHRVPGSGLLAPEQRLLDGREFYERLQNWGYYNADATMQRQAGCDVDRWVQAFVARDDRIIDLLSQGLYRGAMPEPLRQTFREALRDYPEAYDELVSGAALLLQLAFVTPEFGASR